MKHSISDTIAAIATPTGVGGVGVLRISGDESVKISRHLIKDFPKDIIPQKVYHGWVVNNGKPLDEVIYYYMRSPHSYTGEDVIEINGHGGCAVMREVLSLAINVGARVAERGEFTRRAYLNGKIDLLKAEATIDLISAKAFRGVEAAGSQLGGGLSRLISQIRSDLLGILSEIEANLDFNDDVGDFDRTRLREILYGCKIELDGLIDSAEAGRILRDGVRVAIVGRPNVGKSSLLNALLGEERAIVSEISGTTRDTIEESVSINGLSVTLIDTAGIRQPGDKIEEAGVYRAEKEIDSADMVIMALDASNELTGEDKAILQAINASKRIFALNKIDIQVSLSLNGWSGGHPSFLVSALKGDGIDALRNGIFECIAGQVWIENKEDVFINLRQRDCLVKALDGIESALNACSSQAPSEIIAFDLKRVIVSLGEAGGEGVSDEVINSIFDKFCVGK